MANKICPITKEKVLYVECLECEEKICRNKRQKADKRGTTKESKSASYSHIIDLTKERLEGK